jgi:2-haloacid dehalogenase
MIDNISTLTFDVFGTLVDWRGTIIREGQRLGVAADWAAVARRWAFIYAYARREGQPWQPLRGILYRAGEQVLDEFGITLDLSVRQRWADLWSRLEPWPDTVAGLEALRAKGYRLVALSNADVGLSSDLARNAGMPSWDAIIDLNVVQAFKPDPRVYCWGLRQLGVVDGDHVLMVAAHLFDLQGAKALGYRTAFVRRPGEEPDDPTQASYVDIIVDDLNALAVKLPGV